MDLSRSVQFFLSTALAGALALTPVSEASASPLGLGMRKVVQLQEVESAAPAVETPAAEAAPEGPAPAPGPAPSVPTEPPPKKGLGLLISGAVVLGVYGLPLTVSGTILLVASSRNNDPEAVDDISGGLGVVTLLLGLPGLVVGGTLLGVGAYRFSKYRKWKASQGARLLPTVGRTAFGSVVPGLVLRF